MKIFITILILALAQNTYATNNCESKATIKINGLICDFCARAMEKVFGKRPEVSKLKVNLDTAFVELDFKPKKNIPDDEITKLITDSGYDVVSISRTDCK